MMNPNIIVKFFVSQVLGYLPTPSIPSNYQSVHFHSVYKKTIVNRIVKTFASPHLTAPIGMQRVNDMQAVIYNNTRSASTGALFAG